MTGRVLWSRFKDYTRDLTEHARKLGFAGAAICWIFRVSNRASAIDLEFPLMVYVALLFFVAYFITDILQALIGALVVRNFTLKEEKMLHEKTGTIEGDIKVPQNLDRPAFRLFVTKIIFLIIGFVFIGIFIARKLA